MKIGGANVSRTDKERLDWLEAKCMRSDLINGGIFFFHQRMQRKDGHQRFADGERGLRAAIDAAMVLSRAALSAGKESPVRDRAETGAECDFQFQDQHE